MLRQVTVYLHQQAVGYLSQDAQGYHFRYLPDYQGMPISLSLPVAQRSFFSTELFPYFASLAPEGWLKQRFGEIQKIDEQDLFGILLQNGENLIGAIKLIRE